MSDEAVQPLADLVDYMESTSRLRAEVEQLREVLADTGMALALMVNELASRGQDASELEAALLNPIQRALGVQESATPPAPPPVVENPPA